MILYAKYMYICEHVYKGCVQLHKGCVHVHRGCVSIHLRIRVVPYVYSMYNSTLFISNRLYAKFFFYLLLCLPFINVNCQYTMEKNMYFLSFEPFKVKR